MLCAYSRTRRVTHASIDLSDSVDAYATRNEDISASLLRNAHELGDRSHLLAHMVVVDTPMQLDTFRGDYEELAGLIQREWDGYFGERTHFRYDPRWLADFFGAGGGHELLLEYRNGEGALAAFIGVLLLVLGPAPTPGGPLNPHQLAYLFIGFGVLLVVVGTIARLLFLD